MAPSSLNKSSSQYFNMLSTADGGLAHLHRKTWFQKKHYILTLIFFVRYAHSVDKPLQASSYWMRLPLTKLNSNYAEKM